MPNCIRQVLQEQEIMTPGTTIDIIFNPEKRQKIFLIRGSCFIGKSNNFSAQKTVDLSLISGGQFKVNGLYPFSRLPLKDFEILPLQRPEFQLSAKSPIDVLGIELEDLADQLFKHLLWWRS